MAVNATAIWRARPSGSNTNGGGFDPAISGAGTDYSQQNAAQATGVNGTASGTATFTDTTAANFTAAMVGNALWIASGAGFTVGAYFIVTFNSATSVVLDRSPGTGTVAHWAVGGGWADWFTNMGITNSVPVPGNIVYLLGSGTPNPASYSYDYPAPPSNNAVTVSGNATAGVITFANDPATPGYKAPPDTTGGMPLLRTSATSFNTVLAANFINWQGIWLVGQITSGGLLCFNQTHITVFGCVFDTAATTRGVCENDGGQFTFTGNEIFSSTGSSAATSNYQLVFSGDGGSCVGNNIHDNETSAIQPQGAVIISNNIIAKNAGGAIVTSSVVGGRKVVIMNNTIDGNGGNAIEIDQQATLSNTVIMGNIISNHVAGGAVGFKVDAGTPAANNLICPLADYNVYYNNTSNYSGINAGPHDTALGVTPYVASSTENYTLA